jgi:prepilin-type N-terminal cleavage/methylation domain-containing protein
MLMLNDSKRQRRAAFTLMEMLVVVAIIVALAGIGGYFLLGALAGSQKDIAQAQVKALTSACEQYHIKHSHFPENLAVLLQKDEMGGPYLKSEDYLYDPWSTPAQKRPYQYDQGGSKNNGITPDIYCQPPDGSPTIGNWPKGR